MIHMCTFLYKLLHSASVDCRFRRIVPHSTVGTGSAAALKTNRVIQTDIGTIRGTSLLLGLGGSPLIVMRSPLLWTLRRIAIAVKPSSRRMLPHWDNEHLAVNV